MHNTVNLNGLTMLNVICFLEQKREKIHLLAAD